MRHLFPFVSQVYDVLYEGKDVKERAQWLMSHPVMAEIDLPEQQKGGPVRRLMMKLGLPEGEEKDTLV